MLLCSEMPLVWERPEIVKQKAGGWKDWSLAIFFLNYEAIPIWVFPKIGVPQNGWFIMEHPIKIDVFGGIIIFGNTHIYIYIIFKVLDSSFKHLLFSPLPGETIQFDEHIFQRG